MLIWLSEPQTKTNHDPIPIYMCIYNTYKPSAMLHFISRWERAFISASVHVCNFWHELSFLSAQAPAAGR